MLLTTEFLTLRKPYKIIYVCNFKLLSLGVICFAAIDNYYRDIYQCGKTIKKCKGIINTKFKIAIAH